MLEVSIKQKLDERKKINRLTFTIMLKMRQNPFLETRGQMVFMFNFRSHD